MVDSGKKEVHLSQIFKWYKADFGGTDEKVLLNTLQRHIFCFAPFFAFNCRKLI